MMKKLHLKSMIVGLVFGVMSVVIMNNYLHSPIQNAYANDCASVSDIKRLLGYCEVPEDGGFILCY